MNVCLYGSSASISLTRIDLSSVLSTWRNQSANKLFVTVLNFEGNEKTVIISSLNETMLEGYMLDGTKFTRSLARFTGLSIGVMSKAQNFYKFKDIVYVFRGQSWNRNDYPTTIIPDLQEYFDIHRTDTLEEVYSESILEVMRDAWVKSPLPAELFDNTEVPADILDVVSFKRIASRLRTYNDKFYFSEELVKVIRLGRVFLRSELKAGIEFECPICHEKHITDQLERFEKGYCADCEASMPKCAVCGGSGSNSKYGIHLCNAHMNIRDSRLEKYHSNTSRSTPLYQGEFRDNFNLYLGVELEVDTIDDEDIVQETTFAHQYIKKYCKEERLETTRDGSLGDNGFEIISQPKSIDKWNEHEASWTKLFKVLVDCGLRGHDAGHAGLHIHVSKYAFSQPNKSFVRLQVMLHRHYKYCLKLFRRKHSRMLDYAVPLLALINKDHFGVQDIEVLKKFATNNISNHSMLAMDGEVPTFEFRCFRSTLNIETFMATLDFVYGLCVLAERKDFNYANTVSWGQLVEDIDSDRFNAYAERIKVLGENKDEVADFGVELEEELAESVI